MIRSMRIPMVVLASLALGGCGGGFLHTPESQTRYDLGMPEAGSQQPQIVPWRVEVDAPSWLSSSAMQYRLAYVNADARDAFSQSRWVAHPSEMLERYLGAALTNDSMDVSWCRLSLDLDEFVQTFESVDRSHAQMTLRASLRAPRRGGTVARQTFQQQVAAPSADAKGGVTAYREGLGGLTAELTEWLDGIAQDSELAAKCEPGDRQELFGGR